MLPLVSLPAIGVAQLANDQVVRSFREARALRVDIIRFDKAGLVGSAPAGAHETGFRYRLRADEAAAIDVRFRWRLYLFHKVGPAHFHLARWRRSWLLH